MDQPTPQPPTTPPPPSSGASPVPPPPAPTPVPPKPLDGAHSSTGAQSALSSSNGQGKPATSDQPPATSTPPFPEPPSLEDIDQDHPAVLAAKQAVLDHGWVIQPEDAVHLVREVREDLVKYYKKEMQLSPQMRKHPKWEAQRATREQIPEYIHTPEGDMPEIPDDLIEDVAAVIADHGPER